MTKQNHTTVSICIMSKNIKFSQELTNEGGLFYKMSRFLFLLARVHCIFNVVFITIIGPIKEAQLHKRRRFKSSNSVRD